MKTLLSFAAVAGWLSIQAAVAPALTQADAAAEAPQAGGGPSASATASAAEAEAMRAALDRDLREIIARPGWSGDEWSVMVRSLDRGDTLFSFGGDRPLAPASNMKLFTTAAALYYLGPDFRYNTFLMATGPIRDGVLEGDLVLYGTGDPTFSSRFGDNLRVWKAFADTLQAMGVREIRGSIMGDGSYFTGPGAGEGWQQGYMNASYAASAGALSFAENIAMLQIAPGAEDGWRPEVRLVPGGEGIAIVNQATTRAGGSTRISATRMAYDGPIVVRGQIGRGAKPVLRSVPVSDPARLAAATFRAVLVDRQITIQGGLGSAHSSEESPVTGRSVFAPALDSQAPIRVLAVHTSEPILDILTIINKRSHNLMAEQVLRTVGRVAVGEGSVAGGRRAIEHMLAQEGHPADIAVYDGSGLSVLNRASAGDFIDLLALMAASPMWPYYWETLPEAGASDGLRRMYRTGAEGNLRAKTGTIDRVSALSGYVSSANGERLAFSIISNNVPSTWMAKRVEDAIGGRLAEFERPLDAPARRVDPGERAAGGTSEDGVAAPAPVPTQPREPAATQTHRIGRGETLSHLARRYGVSVADIERANPGLNPRRVQVGQLVRIPTRDGPVPTPDQTTGTPPASNAPAAGQPATGQPAAAQPPRSDPAAAQPAAARTHTIRSGDTLDGISKRYSTTVSALQAANPGLNPRRLIPGKTIRIP
ncbi:MAG TPA: D-alanyl-D-alanine carboxypeptidase/D-alanyl-D-alanine-endopeptidase [Longimicrobiales bacterium]|nr:D-alanyl-D-alanine carboxypeptidase/D-alanyl-D-alanine-endopeptidase [Longimicrobiales bacterium]